MKKSVLIADDQAFFRSTLRDILTEAGYLVVWEAADGAEAVEMTKRHRPDIVILDVVMPVKNGIDAALEINGLEPRPGIVVCSSLNNDPITKKALDAGADAFIYKPFDKPRLLETLENL